jgi:hypothetical protein
MVTVCMICHAVLRTIDNGNDDISTGACPLCLQLIYPEFASKPRPALLAKNPSACAACGYLETVRDFTQLEPQGQAVFYNDTECVKRRGWCPSKGHFVNFDEQEIITVKMTDVVTGRKWTETRII